MPKYKIPYQLSDIVIPGDSPPAVVAGMARRKLRLINSLAAPPGAAEKRPKKRKQYPAWKEWKSAATRFQGVEPWLQAKNDLRHITRTPSGYQIRIDRHRKRVFDRTVHGHSKESLFEAVRVRDEAQRQWPQTRRTNPIPAAVLHALGLTEPVVGINRFPRRSVYRVNYHDEAGREKVQCFYYRVVSEEIAYAAAIDFLQRTVRK